MLDEASRWRAPKAPSSPTTKPRARMATLFTFSGELGTSMYFDRLAGRKLEVEALTGAIVAAGERHGIATPLNRRCSRCCARSTTR